MVAGGLRTTRGKSGQRRTGRSLTATGREPRESATETKQPRIMRSYDETSEVRAHSPAW